MYRLSSSLMTIAQLHRYYKPLPKPCKRQKYQTYIWQLTPHEPCTLYEALHIEHLINNTAMLFWTVLIVASAGVLCSGFHCAQLYYQDKRWVSTWRKRSYKFLSYKTLKKWRLVGSFVTMNTWFMLCFGLVRRSLRFIDIWIMTNSAFLCFDIMLLMCKIFFSEERFSLKSAVNYVWPVVLNIFVRLICNALDDQLNPTCAD